MNRGEMNMYPLSNSDAVLVGLVAEVARGKTL